MGVISSAIDSAFDLTASAYLVIKDYRDLAASSGSSGVDALSSTSSVLTSGLSDLVTSVVGDTDKTFQVQFNPSEVQIYASSLPIKKTDAQVPKDGIPKQTADAVIKPTIDMTVNLYFDKTVLTDSFYQDIGGITATNIVTTAATLVGSTVYSIQPQVEGLLAALRNPYTRRITFRWAEFSFPGTLSMVQARYTMFSTTGHPVRATVTLRIRQELDVDTISDWFASYTSAFQGASSSLSSITDTLATSINLNL